MEMVCVGKKELFNDNPVIRETSRNNPTRIFKNDNDAITYIKKVPVHLILMDAQEGIAARIPLIRHLRKRGFYVPIALLVAEANPTTRQAMKQVNVELVLPEELEGVIKAAIENARSKSVKGRRRDKTAAQRKGTEKGAASPDAATDNETGTGDEPDAETAPETESEEETSPGSDTSSGDNPRRPGKKRLGSEGPLQNRIKLKGALEPVSSQSARRKENPLSEDAPDDESPASHPSDDLSPQQPATILADTPALPEGPIEQDDIQISDNESAYPSFPSNPDDILDKLELSGLDKAPEPSLRGRSNLQKQEVVPLKRRGLMEGPDTGELDRKKQEQPAPSEFERAGIQKNGPETADLAGKAPPQPPLALNRAPKPDQDDTAAPLPGRPAPNRDLPPLTAGPTLTESQQVMPVPETRLAAADPAILSESLTFDSLQSPAAGSGSPGPLKEPERLVSLYYVKGRDFPSHLVCHFGTYAKITLAGRLHAGHRNQLREIMRRSLEAGRNIAGICITGHGGMDSAVFSDLSRASLKLKKSGRIICFFSCNEQVERTIIENGDPRITPYFTDEKSFEDFVRGYQPVFY